MVYQLIIFLILFFIVLIVLSINKSNTLEFKIIPKIVKNETQEPVAILMHSFDGYRRYWQGFEHYWNKFYITNNTNTFPMYLANETIPKSENTIFKDFLNCGKKGSTWGKRLISALDQLGEFEYILYVQEDMWLTNELRQDYLQQVVVEMKEKKLKVYKLFNNSNHDIENNNGINDPLWYVVTHQPSIWTADFLKSTLTDKQSPFQHEVSINTELNTLFKHKRDFVGNCSQDHTCLEYEDVSRRGEIRKVGKQMIQDAQLTFSPSKDEIFVRNAY